MNEILKKTHRKENVKLMAARDFTYHRARIINRFKNLLFCVPVFYLITIFISDDFILIGNASISIFLVSLLIGGISILLKQKVTKYKKQSEYFRERYDCNVLGIPFNEFLLIKKSEYDEHIKGYAKKEEKYNALRERFNWIAKLIGEKQTGDQYEIWYGEYFSNNRPADVLSCQCDNIIYSKFLYELVFRWYVVLLSLLIGILLIIYFQLYKYQIFTMDALIEITIAFWAIFTETISTIKRLWDLYHKNDNYLQVIKAQKDNIKKNSEFMFRQIQDLNFWNRSNDAFVPKIFRDWEFRKHSKYRKAVKQFKDEHVRDNELCFKVPASADEIEIYNHDETSALTLSEIQQQLYLMTKDIINVLEQNKIPYTLDGGTLLGAIRNNQFLYWDDDVDLAIPEKEVAKVKAVLSKQLSDDYVIQDHSDPYFSLRLSSFRIRERKYLSEERDSNLYPFYAHRGLFVDIYTYSGTIKNSIIEFVYRKKLHRMYKHLFYYERIKDEKKYLRYKDKYANVICHYLKKVDNEQIAYTPGYINNLKIRGPYFTYADIFNTELIEWQGIKVRVPINKDKVLSSYYGTNYRIPLDDSRTIMKHYRTIDRIT